MVGLRNKASQASWFSDYPLLVAYLEVDLSRDGIKGLLCGSNLLRSLTALLSLL